MPIEFHETFKVPAGTTLLTRTLTIPEEEVVEVDPDSDFEILKKSASRKEQEEEKKEPSVPKEIPAIKNGENEKDASTEKSKKKGFVWILEKVLERCNKMVLWYLVWYFNILIKIPLFNLQIPFQGKEGCPDNSTPCCSHYAPLGGGRGPG